MKPTKEYKGRSTIRMFNVDCMEYMNYYNGKAKVDLAIVDPPYFEEYGKENYTGNDVSTTNVNRQTNEIKHWEIPDKEYFELLSKVSINRIVWGVNYYAKYINDVGRIIWDKRNDSSTFSKCEIASHSQGVRVDMFRFMWNGMLQEDMKNKEKRIHPTQKPVALYKWLLTNYWGDTILDTHGGSMSIAIACWDLGFDLDICELDTDYFNDAVKRFENHISQTQLF